MKWLLLIWVSLASAEEANLRPLKVLPTTDTSDYGLAEPLQNALAVLYQDTLLFQPELSTQTLTGYDQPSIKRAFTQNPESCLSLVYIERERIAVFFFDPTRESHYIAAMAPLSPQGQPMSSGYIERQFRTAFDEIIQLYRKGRFDLLPGASGSSHEVAEGDVDPEMELKSETKILFRELSSVDPRKYYIGAQVGMVRFADQFSHSANTVVLGGCLGWKLRPAFHVELGGHIFAYGLFHVDARYVLPIGEKYLTLSTSIGVARNFGRVTENTGFTSTQLTPGQIFLGPGITLDIPLLGANIRADFKTYFGNRNMVLFGTYGLVYSI